MMTLFTVFIVFFALEKSSPLQNVHYSSLTKEDTTYQSSLEALINKIKIFGYKITNSLPSTYVTDGSVDYTKYIQDAIDKYDSMVFPDFPVLINYQGLMIGSGKVIYFPPESKLIVKPNSRRSYNILNISHSDNVTLINPVIVGDRYQHLGSSGEWGMGIGIYSSKNIKIYNPKVSYCWGDGIYIGEYIKGDPSENIYVSNARCYENRRNGISIVSVDSLQLVNPYAGYSDGTPPMAGIDIEPNNNHNEINNIIILNPVTENNKGDGISIGLSELLGDISHTIGIVIQSQRDTGSTTGCYVSCLKVKRGLVSPEKGNLSGSINIVDPQWENNKSAIFNAYGFRTDDVQLNIISPLAIDSNGRKVPQTILNKILRKHSDIRGRLIIR